jgi:hypothetical protein
VEHPVLLMLREKESNLYFLVQSQASCRLDDPEKIVVSGRWSVGSEQNNIQTTDHHRPTTVFAAIQLSNNKKKSGYDWFLHETGVTAP